jgi:hypothetical protein
MLQHFLDVARGINFIFDHSGIPTNETAKTTACGWKFDSRRILYPLLVSPGRTGKAVEERCHNRSDEGSVVLGFVIECLSQLWGHSGVHFMSELKVIDSVLPSLRPASINAVMTYEFRENLLESIHQDARVNLLRQDRLSRN